MCLAVMALNQHPRYAVVLAANRDEFHARPSAAVAQWQLPGGQPVFSGRDLQAGGTWLGAGATGRVGLLTNVRRPWTVLPSTPSRGHLVTDWLGAQASASVFWQDAAARGCAPFNLLMGDLAADGGSGAGRWLWGSNVGGGADGLAPVQCWLAPSGVFGLSNAALDTPWPKLVRLKTVVSQALARHTTCEEQLCQALWLALAERERSADAQLPQTGLSLELERMLSSVFIDDGQGRYGTRCSSLLLIEQAIAPGRPRSAQLFERRFAPGGALLGQTQLSFTL